MPVAAARSAGTEAIELADLAGDDDNLAVLAPTETLLATLARAEPIGLELVGAHEGGLPSLRTMLRVASPALRAHVGAQLQAVYPQVTPRWWRPDATTPDPAAVGPDERAVAGALRLAHPGYEPILLPRDRDQDPRLAPQADPLLGVLGALQSLPVGWRGLAQLVVRRAAPDWAEPHRGRPAVDPTAEQVRDAARARWSPAGGAGSAPSLGTSITLLLTVLAVWGLVDRFGLPADLADLLQPLSLARYSLALLGPALLVALVTARLQRPALTYDPALVREKLGQRAFYAVQLRLAVIAPASTAPAALAAALDRLADAYSAYDQPRGNRWRRHRLPLHAATALTDLRPLGGRRWRDPWHGRDVLGVRELAGLWHPTAQAAGLAGVARRGYPTRLPTPAAVAGAGRIGVSPHHGLAVPVAVPDAVLDQHLFLLAGTQQGKSSLLLHLAAHLMTRPDRTLVVVDPHHRLGWAVLGLAPPARHGEVVYLDAANTARPFGLNLLDAGLFASCDGAVEGLLRLMEKQFPMAWGVRMEDAFRAAARLLFQLNQQRLAAAVASGIPATTARARQSTVLAITEVITDQKARAALLAEVGDDRLSRWWTRFERKHPHLRDEIVNPVTGKIDYFALTDQVSAILGQPCSTIDPRAWLERPSIVILHTALGTLKEAMAGLLGGTLINLLAQLALERGRPVRGPAAAPPPRLTLLVDEFQTMPGGDYRTILSQLAKFGVNVALATQTLSALEADQGRGRASLRAEVFSNTGGWFCFRGDPIDDHRAVALALGGGLTAEDLNNLPAYHCYARWSVDGERPPAFLVALDPPPASDPDQAWALADASARRYGRDPALIAGWRQATLPRAAPPAGRRHDADTAAGPATRGQPPPIERSSATRALPVDALPPGAVRATTSQRRRGRRPSPAAPTQSALPLGTPLPGTRLVPPRGSSGAAPTGDARSPVDELAPNGATDEAALIDDVDDDEEADTAADAAQKRVGDRPATEPDGDRDEPS